MVLIKELVQQYLNIAINSESKDCQIHAISQMWRVSKLLLESEKGSLIMSMMSTEEEFYSTITQWLKDESIPLKPLLGLIFNSFSCLKNETLKIQFLSNITEVCLI